MGKRQQQTQSIRMACQVTRLTLTLILSLVAVGCGSGGGGESSPPPEPAVASVDTDGDGTPDATDADDDNDGVGDSDDAFPLDPDEHLDTDRDGTGDNADADDDNDGIEDHDDMFPLDPDESLDTDGDGIGNNADMDDDNDAAEDADDAFPLDPGESLDTDGDGIGNNADPDDDNDGAADEDDPHPLDADRGPVAVSVPDPALRAVLLREVRSRSGETLYAHELAKITYLFAEFKGITSLEGLQFATGLQELRLLGNQVSDLSPLSELVELRTLDVPQNTNLEDLKPLRGLANLTELDARANNVSDLTPLSELVELRTLDVSQNTNLEDLKPLRGLANLTELDAGHNNVSDLTPLTGLHQLRKLVLTKNSVANLAPVGRLPELRHLRVAVNDIDDLSSISSLNKLEYLGIVSNPISDLSPLSVLPALSGLSAGGSRLTADLSPIWGLTSLTYLDLESPPLNDLAPLSKLTNLTDLSLGWVDVKGLAPLSTLRSLKGLHLHAVTGVSDLGPLSELANLEALTLRLGRVADLGALADLKALSRLDLDGNLISDLSPLVELPALKRLLLPENRIEDISPLVENAALRAGAWVNLEGNPLNAASLDSHVPALVERGVLVDAESLITRAEDGPRIHSDNVFVLPARGSIGACEGERTTDLAQRFYSYFDDAFDFLALVSNLSIREDRCSRFSGVYVDVSNDTQGIGLSEVSESHEYGSAGRLQGVVVLPMVDRSIRGGPSLHEFMHRWANFVVMPHPHWRHTSAYGQLGGFRADSLVDLGNGRYTAGRFGTVINRGPYSPIELYLAGFIPPDEVPDLLVAEDAEWLRDPDGDLVVGDDGHPIFTATSISRRSVHDIAAEFGVRTPDHTKSQRAFRTAVVLLIDETHPALGSDLDQLSQEVTWFSSVEEEVLERGVPNFHKATGRRATMAMGDLSDFNTGIPVPSTPRRISARSARTTVDGDDMGRFRLDLRGYEMEGWPMGLPHGFPGAMHGAWCKHESHADARTFAPPRTPW